METIWLSPTDYVTGDPSLKISYPSISHPNTIVTSKTKGDLKWISLGLRLPSNVKIEEVIVCYQLSNPGSFISQVRLVEMDTPDKAWIRHDDSTDLKSTSPTSYSSKVAGFAPTAALMLDLRLNFQNVRDKIMLGAVGVKLRQPKDCCWINVKDYGAIGDGNSRPLSERYSSLAHAQADYPQAISLSDEMDGAAIQSALNAVKLAGGGIFLPHGTYLISSTLSVDSCVNILGAGRNAVIRARDASFHVFTLTSGAIGSHLTGFHIQGAATSDTTNQFAIFTNGASTPTNITIDHLLISGSNDTTGCNSGIKLDAGANDWTVSHNHFERLVGITSGHGYGVLLGAAIRNIITHNHFTGDVGQGRHAVYLSARASYNIVAHNIVKDFNEAAFPINTCTYQQASQYNQIVNNTIINGGQLTNDSGAIGIYGNSSYNRVASNTILGYQGEGIIITDGGQGGLCIGNEVVGNSVYNVARFGIVVMGAKDTDVRSNKVFNASKSSPGTYGGIDVRSTGTFGTEVCDSTKVIGNTSWGSSQRTAFRIDPAIPVATNAVVIGNVFRAGKNAGWAYDLNNVPCTFIDNSSDQTRAFELAESDSIDFHLSRTVNLDFPSIAAGTTAELTISLIGVASTGWVVTATPEGAPEAGLMWSAYVSAADTVTIRVANVTMEVINPSSRIFRVQVWRY